VIVDNRRCERRNRTELRRAPRPTAPRCSWGRWQLAVTAPLPKMTVDPLRDFAPVTQVVAVHFVMVANPTVRA